MAHAGFWPAALDPPRLGQLGHRLGHTRRLGVTQALGKEKGVLLPFEFQKPRPTKGLQSLGTTKASGLQGLAENLVSGAGRPQSPAPSARGRLSQGVDQNLKAIVHGLWKRAYFRLRGKPWEVHGDDGRGTLGPVSQGNP